MKKVLITIGILALPLGTYGAVKVQEIMSYDHFAQIQTEDSKVIKIYKVEDSSNTCYVAYTSGWKNGENTAMSCVTSPAPVVPVVKK